MNYLNNGHFLKTSNIEDHNDYDNDSYDTFEYSDIEEEFDFELDTY
jgi:hypothetical protein